MGRDLSYKIIGGLFICLMYNIISNMERGYYENIAIKEGSCNVIGALAWDLKGTGQGCLGLGCTWTHTHALPNASSGGSISTPHPTMPRPCSGPGWRPHRPNPKLCSAQRASRSYSAVLLFVPLEALQVGGGGKGAPCWTGLPQLAGEGKEEPFPHASPFPPPPQVLGTMKIGTTLQLLAVAGERSPPCQAAVYHRPGVAAGRETLFPFLPP